MMGSLGDFYNESLQDFGPFEELIVTADFDYSRQCLILALNDSSIWSLSTDSKRVIGTFEAPHLICIDHLSRAMVVASMHGLVSWWNWDPQSNDYLKEMEFKETGILLNATFVHALEYNLIYLAVAVIRKGQLWIVIYRLDVFESVSHLELIGKKCVGDYHPLHLISQSNLPGRMALITDSNHLFIISLNDFKTGIGWKKVEIPVNSGSIISDFILLPTQGKSLLKQYGYISTDSSQLFTVTIDVSSSRLKVEFMELSNLHPILMISYLKRENGCDILALFGDLCDGSIVKVGTNSVVTLKKLQNSSPALDSVLISDKASSRLIVSCGAKNGRLIDYKSGIPAVVTASSHGFEGVTGIWSLKRSQSDMHHSLLVISFIEQTRIWCFKDNVLEDISDSLGLMNNYCTIYACNFCFNSKTYYCQITEYHVLVLRREISVKWVSETKIIQGLVDGEWIFVQTECGAIVCLRLIVDNLGAQKLIEMNRIEPEVDISCFCALTISKSKELLILGTFNSSLYFLMLQDDESIKKLGEYIFCETDLDKKSSIPNSLITIRNQNNELNLLAGLRNGIILYLGLDMDLIVKGPQFLSLCISILQSTPLGSSPVCIMNSGLENSVIAFSDQSAWVNLKDNTFEVKSILNRIEFGTAFIFEDNLYPSYMIISDYILHCIQFSIGESYSFKNYSQSDSPRRIIYDETFDKLIVAATKYRDSIIYSYVKLLCPTTGNVLCTFSLTDNEIITSMHRWDARGKNNYITLGTGGYYDQNFNDTYGRVIVLGLKSKPGNEYKFKKLGEIALNEKTVSCIRTIQTNYLLVGAGRKLFRLKIEKNQETDERKLTIAETTTVQWPIDCMDCLPISGGELIAIGCQRESISLYKFSASSKKLTYLASDRHSRLPSTVKIISETFLIGGDRLGNIFGLELIKKRAPLENSMDCILSYKTNEPIVQIFCGDFTHYFKIRKSAESFLFDSHPDDASDLKTQESCHLTESISDFSIYALGLTGKVFELRSISPTLYKILFQLEGLLRKHLNLKRSMHVSVIDSGILQEFLSMESSDQSLIVSEWNEQYGTSARGSLTASSASICIQSLM